MDFQGFARPSAFADPDEETRRVHEARGIFDLNGTTLLAISGKDACDYLHRRLTQAIRPIPVGGHACATMLGGDGRMIADMVVRRDGESRFLLIAQPCVRQTLAGQVERYVIADDVTVTDVSSDFSVFAVAGPKPEPRLADPAPLRLSCFQDLSVGLTICPSRESGPLWSALCQSAEDDGGGPCGQLCWEALRIAGRVPLFGADMTPATIPLEAGLLHAISFDKGCYPGQEVVARIHNLGHPANVLVALDAESGPPPVGSAILLGDRVSGTVTSRMSAGFKLKPDALGIVKWDQHRIGTTLRISGEGYESAAQVCGVVGSGVAD